LPFAGQSPTLFRTVLRCRIYYDHLLLGQLEYESLELEDILALSDDHATTLYVIHAMDLTPGMKRQYRTP